MPLLITCGAYYVRRFCSFIFSLNSKNQLTTEGAILDLNSQINNQIKKYAIERNPKTCNNPSCFVLLNNMNDKINPIITNEYAMIFDINSFDS